MRSIRLYRSIVLILDLSYKEVDKYTDPTSFKAIYWFGILSYFGRLISYVLEISLLLSSLIAKWCQCNIDL